MSTPRVAKQSHEQMRRKEIARKAAYRAPPPAAELMVTLGQERLKALQAAGVAVDARTTQVAAFQLAAAAFAAGLSAQSGLKWQSAVLGSLGCLAWFIGCGLAFWGIRSCKNQVAGLDPSFWSGVLTTPRFSARLARSWAAEATEDMILVACRVDEVRARWLNMSLIAGGVGATLLLAAVGLNVVGRLNDQVWGPKGQANPVLPSEEVRRPVGEDRANSRVNARSSQ